jgi:hypothetical protein
MSWRHTEALTTARQAADDPRTIEGVALPYGIVSGQVDLDGRGNIGQEVHYPGAARSSVEHWMGRQDGAKMPFRPRHGERPVGTVQVLEDAPDGVHFRARIMPSPAGDAYLAELAEGINGISVEFGPGSVRDSRMRDGTVVHRDIKLHAIAGSDIPAFDGARVALRDMQEGTDQVLDGVNVEINVEVNADDDEDEPCAACAHMPDCACTTCDCALPVHDAAATEPTPPPSGGALDANVKERNAVSGPTPTPDPTPDPEPTPGVTPPVPGAIVIPPGTMTAPAAPAPVPATPAQRDMLVQARESTDPVVRDAAERLGVLLQMQGHTPIRITAQPSTYSRDSGNSFLRDLQAARQGNSAAMDRQARHQAHLTDIAVNIERAGDLLQSEIPGALPNDYLPGLLTPRILKGRPMGSFFARIPIADSRPRIFAKVTTSSSVAVQSAEGAALTATDIATTAVTATPLMYGTYIDVSRQVIDSADPGAEGMVMQDLQEAYAQASETVIKTAVEAGASASGTAITAATPYAGVLGNVIKYYATRFKPAQGAFIPSALYSVLLAQGDTTGRPFLPMIGSMNSDGTVAEGGIQANVLGAATKLSYASTANVCVFAVPTDYVIYESSIASFSYDQVVGPQAVRIGLWAYLVVGTRLGGLSVTAA